MNAVNARLTRGLIGKIEENSSYQTINTRVAVATGVLTVWSREFSEDSPTKPSVIRALTQS